MRPCSRVLHVILATVLVLAGLALPAEFPATPSLPEEIKPAYEVLKADYPKFERKRAPKPPADSVWVFRSARMSEGTIDIGFEGKDVVYILSVAEPVAKHGSPPISRRST